MTSRKKTHSDRDSMASLCPPLPSLICSYIKTEYRYLVAKVESVSPFCDILEIKSSPRRTSTKNKSILAETQISLC